ncbi:hypothetical protein EGH21_12535 [Halomicroarcula sp. F13]|uniref:Small CPxCG-related zinc finger protein n=1 Tax=Haloarcula rubra TaxID=2487747 RepID=A0AAW4PUA7_9EURY|nr:hypothetical protein [Halomicroarcula rubra]MBX0323857.1 hypothetical protein [Halomicroarcula rubra]
MTLYPSGGEAATLVLAYCLVSWFVGGLYGAYAWERAHRDRSLREICGFGDEEVATDGGRDTFACDGCGDETPIGSRWRYLRPDQPDDEIATDHLCPRCSTRKDSSRLFRSADDIGGGAGE